MTHVNQPKANQNSKGINPVAAVMTGVIIGAGVAAAGVGVVAMQDKKNRDKAKEVINNVKDKVKASIEDMNKNVQDKKADIKEKVLESANNTNDNIHEGVKNALNVPVKK